MEFGLPIQDISFTTNVTDETYPEFDNTSYVVKGGVVKYGDEIYSAYTNIYPLATYLWNDIASGVTAEVIKLDDKTVMSEPTVIPCVQDVTVVYIQDTYKTGGETVIGKYFIYVGITGNVDFTAVDPTIPGTFHFEEIKNQRHFDVIPTRDSVYWKYEGVANSKRHLDGTIYSQTVLDTTGTIVNEYTISGTLTAVVFYNMDVQEVAVTVKDQLDNILLPRYEISLRDYQGITTPYAWFFTPVEGLVKTNAFTKIAPYTNPKITIEYKNLANPPKIGETLFARMINIGKTGNKPQGRAKPFDVLTMDNNGVRAKVEKDAFIDEMDYRVFIEKNRSDAVITQLKKILRKNIVVIGDETGEWTNAIHYGWIAEHPYELDSASTESTYSIKLTTLA